jgi:hypothetical protein
MKNQNTFGAVGLGGVEPPTSRLSGVRSNHLSYRPREPNNLALAWAPVNRTGPPILRYGAIHAA